MQSTPPPPLLLLLDLPLDLCLEISMRWLTMEDLCRLDTALCTQRSRREWFIDNVLGSSVAIYPGLKDEVLSNQYYLRWICHRKVSVRSLHISLERESHYDVISQHKCTKHVKKLVYSGDFALAFNEPASSSLAMIWCNLRTLDLSKSRLVTETRLEYLAKQCTNLTSLSLSHLTCVTDQTIKVFTTHCPQISRLGAPLIIFRPKYTHFNTFLSHTTSFMSFMSFIRPKFTFLLTFLSQIILSPSRCLLLQQNH